MMPVMPEVTETHIDRFLAAARETIADVPYCWRLATRSATDGGHQCARHPVDQRRGGRR